MVKECGEEGLTLGSRGAFFASSSKAAHLGVARMGRQAREGSREGEEVCGGEDVSSGHQKVSCSWVMSHRWWVFQGLMVHGFIVVVREVVHNIARVTWVGVGVVVEMGLVVEGRKTMRFCVRLHIVRHLRLVRGGDVVMRHRCHVMRFETKDGLKGLGFWRSICRFRWMIGRGRFMVGWLWCRMICCVDAEDLL